MQNEPFRMRKITTTVIHNKIQFEEFDYYKMADAIHYNIITTSHTAILHFNIVFVHIGIYIYYE